MRDSSSPSPIYSLKKPPTPVERLSFPSLNVPAPPHPWNISLDFLSGRSSPFSKSKTFRFFFEKRNSSAANIPAGPVRTMMQSYFKSEISRFSESSFRQHILHRRLLNLLSYPSGWQNHFFLLHLYMTFLQRDELCRQSFHQIGCLWKNA